MSKDLLDQDSIPQVIRNSEGLYEGDLVYYGRVFFRRRVAYSITTIICDILCMSFGFVIRLAGIIVTIMTSFHYVSGEI